MIIFQVLRYLVCSGTARTARYWFQDKGASKFPKPVIHPDPSANKVLLLIDEEMQQFYNKKHTKPSLGSEASSPDLPAWCKRSRRSNRKREISF